MLAEPGCLLGRFDAFSNRYHIQASCQRQHGIQNRRSDRFRTDGIHKTAIDFEVIHREAFQINQRAVASTKIIYRNFKAFMVQPFE
ncbi:hypothetical protein D3C71_1506020 [compost metagenome]